MCLAWLPFLRCVGWLVCLPGRPVHWCVACDGRLGSFSVGPVLQAAVLLLVSCLLWKACRAPVLSTARMRGKSCIAVQLNEHLAGLSCGMLAPSPVGSVSALICSGRLSSTPGKQCTPAGSDACPWFGPGTRAWQSSSVGPAVRAGMLAHGRGMISWVHHHLTLNRTSRACLVTCHARPARVSERGALPGEGTASLVPLREHRRSSGDALGCSRGCGLKTVCRHAVRCCPTAAVGYGAVSSVLCSCLSPARKLWPALRCAVELRSCYVLDAPTSHCSEPWCEISLSSLTACMPAQPALSVLGHLLRPRRRRACMSRQQAP